MKKDIDITKKYGIPTRTLQDWKNRTPDNWRYKVYMKMKKEKEENGQ